MINLQNSVISRTERGIIIDDPGLPWFVHVTAAANPTRLTHLTVESKPGHTTPITAARIARFPTGQLLHVAALHLLDETHPNEAYYRTIAAPLPHGQRTWPETHWDNVRTVAAWADDTMRPGGARQAVADLWAVTTEPTARRWLRHAQYQPE